MKTKKLILTILTAILLTSLFVVTVAAAGAVATTDGKSCARGKTVTLNVNLAETSGVIAGAVAVEYDSSRLELVEAKWNAEALPGLVASHYDEDTDKGVFLFSNEKTVSGNLFSVTFEVLDSAPLGETEVSCEIQLQNKSGDFISVTNSAGYVDVICEHKFDQKNDQHLASAATCTAPASYYYTCSICGEVGCETYTSGSALPHTFDQQKATFEYLVEDVKCVDEADYYYSCSCGAKGSESFKADASWSHNYSDNWQTDAENHWHQCDDCKKAKDEAAHTPNDENICTECNYDLGTEETHTHDFSSTMKTDGENHWYECSCGVTYNVQSHKWNEGKCEICDTEEPEIQPDEDDGSQGGFLDFLFSNLWLLLLIIFGIFMGIAFIINLSRDRYYYYW